MIIVLQLIEEDEDGPEMYIMSDIPHMLRIDPNNLQTLYKVGLFNYIQCHGRFINILPLRF